MDNTNRNWIIAIVVGILLLCCCIGAVCVLTGSLTLWGISREESEYTPDWEFPSEVTFEAFPTDDNTPLLEPTPIFEATPEPGGSLDSSETLQILEEEIVPINDPRDLAFRLEGKENIPETVEGPAEPFQVGEVQEFWASNVDTNENFKVTATLRYVTDHLYFWIENGVDYDPKAVKDLAETFENEIYPTNREFFGSEWSPGIDNDPHLYLMYVGGIGSSIAGYFSSADEIHPNAHQYSNAHEMFFINSDNVRLARRDIYGTIAHEFQHMIHWYRDRNEETWVNEGFSMLAELLNNYDTGGFDMLYAQDPDLQLNFWPSPPNSTPHYGSSFLFFAYFLDRFGEEATRALVAHPDNGFDSIDRVMEDLNQVDPNTGEVIQSEDVFGDWVVANLLNDSSVEDGRFAYERYTGLPTLGFTEEIDTCSPDWQVRSVKQYGVDYLRVNCCGCFTLQLQGSQQVGVLPVDAYSGDYAFWSNKGDESDMTLTRTFDLTQASGPLTLNYRIWYDLEEDYDYLYLVVSEDGENWKILQTPSGCDRSEDPSGNAYGWAYNGQSGDWIEENVDLSDYAGKQIQVRFEYVTDAAVNGEGLMLDDVSIPELDYSEDFEDGEGDWQGDGFVRIHNSLPQTFRVSLIKNGDEITVEEITLDENLTASVPLELGGDVEDAVLVVSGTARFTTQEATYRFSFK